MSRFIPPALGWHRDLPDPRDFSPRDANVSALLKATRRPRGARTGLPAKVNWQEYCAPVEDQQPLASCTAHACIGLFQYFERRATGRAADPSPLFLYRTSRQLLRWTGDTGASLRTALKAMVRFGIPPAELWPYDPARLDATPDPFLYSFARDYQAIRYVRLDPADGGGADALGRVKAFLAAGFPSLFGFSALRSLTGDADIPAPTVYDSVCGGQAAVAVGYDDNRRIRSARGALLVRNSWGSGWGEGGYGWLPYAYVEQRLAVDFWTLLKPDWLDSGEFEHPLGVP
jgi:C1A family cysteine protease